MQIENFTMGYLINALLADVLQLAISCLKSTIIFLAGAGAVECRHIMHIPWSRLVMYSSKAASMLDGLSYAGRAEALSGFPWPVRVPSKDTLVGLHARQPPGHMLAILLILSPKAPAEPALLIEWDMHQLHCQHQQEVVEQVAAVEDERLAKDQCKDSQEHGVAGVLVQSLHDQAPAQDERQYLARRSQVIGIANRNSRSPCAMAERQDILCALN